MVYKTRVCTRPMPRAAPPARGLPASDAVGAVDLRASSGSRVSCVRVGCWGSLPDCSPGKIYLAEKSEGHMDCGSRGPLRAWRRAGGGWARREGAHRQEVLVAAEPSQRSRARAWRPEWCPHEHTNSPTDRGGARHRDLRPRPDEGWNRAEAASSCHSRCRLFFAAERWRRSDFRRK